VCQEAGNMKYRIEFGFGVGEDAYGDPVEPARLVTALGIIRKTAADLFEGYTMHPTTGGWVNNAGRLVEEPGFTLFVVSDWNDAEVWKMVDTIKTEHNQHALAVTATQVIFDIL